jgi:hypothetical protein
MVIDAVEPTLPVLPPSPLTVEEQLPSVPQPSALTAAGNNTIASATTSRK